MNLMVEDKLAPVEIPTCSTLPSFMRGIHQSIKVVIFEPNLLAASSGAFFTAKPTKGEQFVDI
jgi:hypothetical protein